MHQDESADEADVFENAFRRHEALRRAIPQEAIRLQRGEQSEAASHRAPAQR